MTLEQTLVQAGSELTSSHIEAPEYGYFPNATLKLFMTDICNLSCEGCFMQSSLMRLTRNKYSSIEKDKAVQLMDEARKNFATELVEFSGGEVTLELEELCELIGHAKEIGFRTRIVTNGTILGREGSYSENLSPYLPKNLQRTSPEEAVEKLKSAGLDAVLLSIDSMHNIVDSALKTDRVSARAPVSTMGNAVRILLDAGYGTPVDLASRVGNSLRIAVTAAGDQYEKSFDILDQVMESADRGLHKIETDSNRVWEASDGKRIYVHRNETADVGFGRNLNDDKLTNISDTVYTRSCYVFAPRSAAVKSTGGVHQEICVFPDGVVSTCAYRSHVIGDHNKQSLVEIVKSVNDDNYNPPIEIATSVLTFRELLHIAEEMDGKGVWGEAFRRIVSVEPDLKGKIESFKSHTGACGALFKEPGFLEALTKYRRDK